jgi:hypothetical protein
MVCMRFSKYVSSFKHHHSQPPRHLHSVQVLGKGIILTISPVAPYIAINLTYSSQPPSAEIVGHANERSETL